jgi:hypothetical protein
MSIGESAREGSDRNTFARAVGRYRPLAQSYCLVRVVRLILYLEGQVSDAIQWMPIR